MGRKQSSGCFAAVLVRKSPEQLEARQRVESQAGALGLTVSAQRRFPVVEVKDAVELAALSRVLRAGRYRFDALPWKGLIEVVVGWKQASRDLVRPLKAPGLIRPTPAQKSKLKRLVQATRASTRASRALLAGDWSPQLADLAALPLVQAIDVDDNDFMSCLRLGLALEEPLAARMKALVKRCRDEAPELEEVRRALCGASPREASTCARACLAAFRHERPMRVASFQLVWAQWAEALPKPQSLEVARALSERFCALFEKYDGVPFRLTREEKRLTQEELSPPFTGSWFDAWVQALWGSDDEGGRFLKRHLAAALKTRGHERPAEQASRASPF